MKKFNLIIEIVKNVMILIFHRIMPEWKYQNWSVQVVEQSLSEWYY